MNDLLKRRLTATDEKLAALKAERKARDKTRRSEVKQSRTDRQRKTLLVGEAVLRRVAAGEWDETDFRQMMDEVLSRPADRALFDLDDNSDGH